MPLNPAVRELPPARAYVDRLLGGRKPCREFDLEPVRPLEVRPLEEKRPRPDRDDLVDAVVVRVPSEVREPEEVLNPEA